MRSYASIDKIEGKYAVCEVELVPVEESKANDFANKDCKTMEVFLQEVLDCVGDAKEGDILVVEHDRENVNLIYKNDEEEKERRLKVLRSIMS